jgi:hypothetical protein
MYVHRIYYSQSVLLLAIVRTNSCSDCGLMANMGITLYYIMSNT